MKMKEDKLAMKVVQPELGKYDYDFTFEVEVN